VALTARAMAGDRELSLAAGCSGYISKPIDTRTIAADIERFLTPAQ
jgi:CheY-like chemotaxis protein